MKSSIILLAFISSLSVYGQVPELENAQIETMKLSTPIPTMGRLGGLSIDKLGFLYVSNFRDKVWKVSPSGEVTLLANGLYGSSGNYVDRYGNLIQSSFYENAVYKINRQGESTMLSNENISGPVGVIADEMDNIYVCNCSGNSITKIDKDGKSTIFSESDLYNCPNGVTIGPEGNLYVTNYSNDIIVKITPDGETSKFTTVSGGEGNAHIVFMKDNFYVTKIKANTVHRISPTGESSIVAGAFNSNGLEDGSALTASLSRPNGIAADPYGSTLFVNNLNGDWVITKIGNPGTIVIRKIDIRTVTEIFDEVLQKNGLDAAVEAFWQYHNAPKHQHEDIGVEMGTYAWQLMIQRKVPEAIRVFTLMTETYPDRWRPYYYLGEVYKIIGQNEKALEYYNQSLEKNPSNPLVESKIKELGSD